MFTKLNTKMNLRHSTLFGGLWWRYHTIMKFRNTFIINFDRVGRNRVADAR